MRSACGRLDLDAVRTRGEGEFLPRRVIFARLRGGGLRVIVGRMLHVQFEGGENGGSGAFL